MNEDTFDLCKPIFVNQDCIAGCDTILQGVTFERIHGKLWHVTRIYRILAFVAFMLNFHGSGSQDPILSESSLGLWI